MQRDEDSGDNLGVDNSWDENELIESRPWFPKNKFRKGNIRTLIGEKCSDLLSIAIDHVLEMSPDLDHESTMMVFPSIEGVGEYVDTDENMKVGGENIWVVGDASGDFRGLIPAFVSGYYAGLECISLRKAIHAEN